MIKSDRFTAIFYLFKPKSLSQYLNFCYKIKLPDLNRSGDRTLFIYTNYYKTQIQIIKN